MDGVLISGGADIDPALYGEETLPECGALDPARDRQEMLMAKWSRSAGKPALGICRGCQVMNVAAGGTLVQDIASTYHISKDVHSQPEDYAVTTHWVDLVPGTLAADVMGCEEVRVNSRHHQCVKELAPGMVLDGRSRDDGIIESFHDPKHPFTSQCSGIRKCFRQIVQRPWRSLKRLCANLRRYGISNLHNR